MATSNYPQPAFHFRVEWGGTSISFTEVTGLNIENQVIEYRDGASMVFSTVKMPGLQKFSNVTLKRGIFSGDNDYYDWLDTIKMNTIDRRPVTISLLDEDHNPVMVWKLNNAFPVKIDGASLKASGNEVAIESMEIAHEGLVIENG